VAVAEVEVNGAGQGPADVLGGGEEAVAGEGGADGGVVFATDVEEGGVAEELGGTGESDGGGAFAGTEAVHGVEECADAGVGEDAGFAGGAGGVEGGVGELDVQQSPHRRRRVIGDDRDAGAEGVSGEHCGSVARDREAPDIDDGE
jgi:hypothetical protein